MFKKFRKGKQVVEDIKNMIALVQKVNTHFKGSTTLKRETYNEYAKELNLYKEEIKE